MFARAHVSSVEIPASELKIGSELQRGGMGAVLTGKWLGISVAVKTVTDVSKQEALLREAELLASMRHPCICQFYGASRIDGTFVMVMELLDCSLHEVIACPRSIPSALCLRLAHETAQGIAYLHRNNLLHRDIKPSNVMLDKLQHAKVCDFGLSKPYVLTMEVLGDFAYLLEGDSPDSARSADGTGGSRGTSSANSANTTYAVGTLRYMAPEVVQSTDEAVKMVYEAPSDVYSFGILLWELAHRQLPFAGIEGVEVAIKVARSGQRPPLQLPKGLQDLEPIIASCWHCDPNQRPPMSVCAERLCALDRH